MEDFKNDIVLELPNISSISFTKIDKKYLKVITINFFLFFIPFFITLIILHQYVFEESVLEYITYIYSFLFLFFGYIFAHLYLGFSKRKYAIREKDITYSSGLFIKKMTTVPFSRIQHIEIDEKPISRLFNLAAISVYTAGDSSDDLVIKGLKKVTAKKIKELISTKINE